MVWEKSFKCTGCGACCHRAYRVVFHIREDGCTCVHLGDDNLCKIYESRPWVCRVDEVFKTKKNISRRDYYIKISKKCNEWMIRDGIDPKYHIDIEREYGISVDE